MSHQPGAAKGQKASRNGGNPPPQKQPLRPPLTFVQQRLALPEPVTSKAPYITRFVIQNVGQVCADIFVDVSAAKTLELMEQEAQEGVSIRQVNKQEMLSRLEQFGQASASDTGAKLGKAKKTGQESEDGKSKPLTPNYELDKGRNDYLDKLAADYSIPLFKNATDADYREYLNVLMSGQNLSDVYAQKIVKSSETKSVDANKIFQISIQPNHKMTLNISITENQQQNNGEQKYVFMNIYMLGIHHAADVTRTDSEIDRQIA